MSALRFFATYLSRPAESSLSWAALANASAAKESPVARISCSLARIDRIAFSRSMPGAVRMARSAALAPSSRARGSLGLTRLLPPSEPHAKVANKAKQIRYFFICIAFTCDYRLRISVTRSFTSSISHLGVEVAPQMPMLVASASHSGLIWLAFDTK